MNINFFENYNVNVEFEIDKENYGGELIIEKGFISRLEVKTGYNYLSNKEIPKKIVCKKKDNYGFLTLHDISYDSGIFYFKFLTTGNDDISEYRKIKIGLTGITTWFEACDPVELNNTELRKDVHLDEFSADFVYEKEKYEIKNSRDIRFKEINKEKYVIEIEDFILIKSVVALTLDKIKDISCRIMTLFSILIGAGLSITSIYLIDTNEKKKSISLFFDYGSYDKIPLRYAHHAFSNFHKINRKNIWESILNNFFSKEIFKCVGGKLPYLMGGCFNTWEYEVFAVLAVFERCCNLLSSSRSHKLKKKDFESLKINILLNFDSYVKKNLELDKNVICSIREGIDGIKNTSVISLGDKIKKTIATTPSEIRDIIRFDNDTFRLATKIRNAIAHGNAYDIKENLNKEFVLKNKSMVFLMYFLFRELGIDDKFFVKSLSKSRNNFAEKADLDHRSMDKFSGLYDFIDIVGNVDNDINPEKYIFIVLNFINGDYYFNNSMTKCVFSDFRNSEILDVKDFVKEKIDHKKYTVDYSVSPYITIKGEEKRWHGAVLIKENKL